MRALHFRPAHHPRPCGSGPPQAPTPSAEQCAQRDDEELQHRRLGQSLKGAERRTFMSTCLKG